MSARAACFNCGDGELRVAIGKATSTGKRIPLRACRSCGYLVVALLDAEQAAANLAVLAEEGIEVQEGVTA